MLDEEEVGEVAKIINIKRKIIKYKIITYLHKLTKMYYNEPLMDK